MSPVQFAIRAFLCAAVSSTVQGAVIYGGPTYDVASGTGFRDASVYIAPGAPGASGAATGTVTKYTARNSVGFRAFRLTSSGTTALDNLYADSSGKSLSVAVAVNASGTVVGGEIKYNGSTNIGNRPIRWDAGGTAAIELDNLGTSSSGITSSEAYGINAAGNAVGYATKYSGGTNLGDRAVSWSPGGTAAVELGNIGTTKNGFTISRAYTISSSGTVIGFATKYSNDTDLGRRAVRWDAGSTSAVELGNIGTSSSGSTDSYAVAVNTVGTIVGYAAKYSELKNLGNRAVIWNAGGTAALELGNLGASSSGITYSSALAVNRIGTAVGYAAKYNGSTERGDRAVRWDAGSTVATELGNLGISSTGFTDSRAYSINEFGIAVGKAIKYDANGLASNSHAVIWGADNVAVDLNNLLPTEDALNWILEEAHFISDDGWISGIGTYYPDGLGSGKPLYRRAFLLQDIPEPGCLIVVTATPFLCKRVRRRVFA